MTESGQNKRVNTYKSFIVNNLGVDIVSIIGLNLMILRGVVQGVGMCARPGPVLTRTVRVPNRGSRWDEVGIDTDCRV